jgi:RND family efflux transporter MFP subunit
MKPKILAIALLIVLAVGLGFFFTQSKPDVKAATAEPVKAVSVSVVKAVQKNVTEQLSLVGTLQAVRDVPLVSETQGKVKKLYADVGAFLATNAPIVEVDAALKQSTFLAAKARYEKAKRDAARFAELRNENNASENDVESAKLAAQIAEADFKAAERQLSDATIRAPFAGYLTERNVEIGAVIEQGTIIGTVIDLSSVKLKVYINEQEAFKLKIGDKVSVMTDVYPAAKLIGTIHTIGLKADAAHAFPIEILIPNNKAFPLRAGQTAKAEFNFSERFALVIPRLALVANAAKTCVYKVNQGTAMLQEVSIGRSFGADVEITSGLIAGETVVVVGHNNLKGSGGRIEETEYKR